MGVFNFFIVIPEIIASITFQDVYKRQVLSSPMQLDNILPLPNVHRSKEAVHQLTKQRLLKLM